MNHLDSQSNAKASRRVASVVVVMGCSVDMYDRCNFRKTASLRLSHRHLLRSYLVVHPYRAGRLVDILDQEN